MFIGCQIEKLHNQLHLLSGKHMLKFCPMQDILPCEPLLKSFLSFLFLKNGSTPASFVFFSSFQIQFYRKSVDFNRIRTQIVGVEGEHTDHLTTTTAALFSTGESRTHVLTIVKRACWPLRRHLQCICSFSFWPAFLLFCSFSQFNDK